MYYHRDEVGRRWQLLEKQCGQTQEPTIQGFIDMATVEAASSKHGLQAELTESESVTENGTQSPNTTSVSSLSPTRSTSPAPAVRPGIVQIPLLLHVLYRVFCLKHSCITL